MTRKSFLTILLILLINLNIIKCEMNNNYNTLNLFLNSLRTSNTHLYIIQSPIKEREEHMKSFIELLGNKKLKKYTTIINSFSYSNLNDTSVNLMIKNGILSKEWVEKVDPPSGTRYRINRLASSYSHMLTIKNFLSSSYSNAIIFEDDIGISKQFKLNEVHDSISTLLTNSINLHWDGIFLGFCSEYRPSKESIMKISHPNTSIEVSLTTAKTALCTHSMLYSREFAQIVYDRFLPIRGTYDIFLRDIYCSDQSFRVYRTQDPIFIQLRNKFRSTLNNSRPLTTFRKYPSYKCDGKMSYSNYTY